MQATLHSSTQLTEEQTDTLAYESWIKSDEHWECRTLRDIKESTYRQGGRDETCDHGFFLKLERTSDI